MLLNCYFFWKNTFYPWILHFAFNYNIFQSKKVNFDQKKIIHIYSDKSISLDEMEYMNTEKEQYNNYYNQIIDENNFVENEPKNKTSSYDYNFYDFENNNNIHLTFNVFNQSFAKGKKQPTMSINTEYCYYCKNRISTQLHMYNDNAYCSSECRTHKINNEKRQKKFTHEF